MLGQVLREIFAQRRPSASAQANRPRVLNVGGGDRAIPIPSQYDGWAQVLLDIDARGNPDICCDARTLTTLEPAQFDAIYCSHNLEHYYRHDAMKVLSGFRHVLKPSGFAEIRVPDIQSVIRHVMNTGMDLGDDLYQSPAGPIAAIDVLYGLGREIEQSGRDYYAHKNGFTPKLLRSMLETAGFASVRIVEIPEIFELRAIAFQSDATQAQLRLLGIGP